ncbi:hypothetical protein PP939_gp188 [Rhizobium phage RL38J1]|uniref:Uncharacterized protein n=1 Tax=Rhizobium phage RL38J1 TaxID=2663232 RepID=A0A6B9J3K4_9CAUD|nr:hypothetical protein PP939_gp188 [Rhizobium phage RL38J1]QGZ14048.1 hypothetical protein RL38J1_188 [Rhizobium phage RL38J1]
MLITAEMLKDFAEESAIREAKIISPSLGLWLENFIKEHGNDLSVVSNILSELKICVDNEISYFNDCVEKNGDKK